MDQNYKNALQEWLQSRGFREQVAVFTPLPGGVKVRIFLPPDLELTAEGKGINRLEAEMQAASRLLEGLRMEYPDLVEFDWEGIRIAAQAGDALIKLAAYRAKRFSDAAAKSLHLQKFESDSHLASLFDRWQAGGMPETHYWGDHLSRKRKATLVEAIIWWRYADQVLQPGAQEAFQQILKDLADAPTSS